MTGVLWPSRALVRFDFETWVNFMFSFRRRTSSVPPSQLTILLTAHDQRHPASAP